MAKFCFVSVMISLNVESGVATRSRSEWVKCKQPGPILYNSNIRNGDVAKN